MLILFFWKTGNIRSVSFHVYVKADRAFGRQLVMLWVTLVLKTRESFVGPAKWRNGPTCLMQKDQTPPRRCVCQLLPLLLASWMNLQCVGVLWVARQHSCRSQQVSQHPHCSRTSLTSTPSLTTAASYEEKINLPAGQRAKTHKVFVLLWN